jgi:hypothetical protein
MLDSQMMGHDAFAMAGFNPAWFAAIGVGVLLVVADFLIPETVKRRAGWILLLVGLLCLLIGVVGLGRDYLKNKGAAAIQQPPSQKPEPQPPSQSPPKKSSKGQSQTTSGNKNGQKRREQNDFGGPNTKQQSSGNDSPNISQSGPCSVAQIGGTGNSAEPNCTIAPTTYYDIGGVRHTERPGETSVDDQHVEGYRKMTEAANKQDWSTLRDLSETETTSAPEWPTPYYYAGKAYTNLCDKERGEKYLTEFLEKAKDRDDYSNTAKNAKDLLLRLTSGDTPPQCASKP